MCVAAFANSRFPFGESQENGKNNNKRKPPVGMTTEGTNGFGDVPLRLRLDRGGFGGEHAFEGYAGGGGY